MTRMFTCDDPVHRTLVSEVERLLADNRERYEALRRCGELVVAMRRDVIDNHGTDNSYGRMLLAMTEQRDAWRVRAESAEAALRELHVTAGALYRSGHIGWPTTARRMFEAIEAAVSPEETK